MAQSSAKPAEGFVPRVKYYVKGQGEGENLPRWVGRLARKQRKKDK